MSSIQQKLLKVTKQKKNVNHLFERKSSLYKSIPNIQMLEIADREFKAAFTSILKDNMIMMNEQMSISE